MIYPEFFTICQICCKKSVKFAQYYFGRSHYEKISRRFSADGGEKRGKGGKIRGAKRFAFLPVPCYNRGMKETYLEALDDFFAAHYSDYIKLAALEGYRRPELLTVDRDGNIGRKDSSFLRLSYQAECKKLLETLKAGAIEDPKIANKFLDIIEIESDRLSNLISDTLLLSEIESKKEARRGKAHITLPASHKLVFRQSLPQRILDGIRCESPREYPRHFII